jgi:hypothetical protein
MSSTRRADASKPMAFEKYMSAPEFVALRPIPGNAVLSKALLYPDPKVRELAFFLQGMSMQPGGISELAKQLVTWHPDRCRETDCRDTAIFRLNQTLERTVESFESHTAGLLSEFLVDLMLDPKLSLSKIDCPYFDNLGGALQQFKACHEKGVWDGFVITTTGTAVHEMLDQALNLSRMVVIEGMAGAGKSTNAKAWCAAHSGRARYMSLTGITNRTTFFQKIDACLGFPTCQRKAQQMQIRIEDFFARSKMMLVIDEAHFLWPQNAHRTAPPELIDWIDTALVNYGVPVALLCTDQFSKLKNRVERNTGWTSEQFIHRVFRFRKLDDKPTREDAASIAQSLLSAAWDENKQRWLPSDNDSSPDAIDALVSYAMSQDIPLSCISDCMHEARSYARAGGRVVVSKNDLRKSFRDGQILSDAALSRAFAPAPMERRRRSPHAPETAGKPNKAYVSNPPTRTHQDVSGRLPQLRGGMVPTSIADPVLG